MGSDFTWQLVVEHESCNGEASDAARHKLRARNPVLLIKLDLLDAEMSKLGVWLRDSCTHEWQHVLLALVAFVVSR